MTAQCKLTSPNPETQPINPMNTIAAVLRGSARRIIPSLALALLAGVAMLAASASAQTVACSANNNANEINFNGPLIFGHRFYVSGAGIEVSQLGFYDHNNQPLTYSPVSYTHL